MVKITNHMLHTCRYITTIRKTHITTKRFDNSKLSIFGEFPGGPTVRTFTTRGLGLIPGQGIKILHASQPKTNKKISDSKVCKLSRKPYKRFSEI